MNPLLRVAILIGMMLFAFYISLMIMLKFDYPVIGGFVYFTAMILLTYFTVKTKCPSCGYNLIEWPHKGIFITQKIFSPIKCPNCRRRFFSIV